jgi:hypothetical protein
MLDRWQELNRYELQWQIQREMLNYQLAPPMLYDRWGRRKDEIYIVPQPSTTPR